jgi:hypothetical protein
VTEIKNVVVRAIDANPTVYKSHGKIKATLTIACLLAK